jgi:hypothetical protein
MTVTVEAMDLAHFVQSNAKAILGSETPEQLTSTAVGRHPFAGKLKAVVLLFLAQHKCFSVFGLTYVGKVSLTDNIKTIIVSSINPHPT